MLNVPDAPLDLWVSCNCGKGRGNNSEGKSIGEDNTTLLILLRFFLGANHGIALDSFLKEGVPIGIIVGESCYLINIIPCHIKL